MSVVGGSIQAYPALYFFVSLKLSKPTGLSSCVFTGQFELTVGLRALCPPYKSIVSALAIPENASTSQVILSTMSSEDAAGITEIRCHHQVPTREGNATGQCP